MGHIIDTPRLRLRPVCQADAYAIADLINNPRISRNLRRVKFPYSLDDAQGWLALIATSGESEHVFAVTLAGRLIGVIGLEGDPGSMELGYWLGERWWGKGYMTEAATAMLDYAFSALECERATSGYRHGNEASWHILSGLGFRHTGHACVHSAASRTPMDIATLEITRREWLARPA